MNTEDLLKKFGELVDQKLDQIKKQLDQQGKDLQALQRGQAQMSEAQEDTINLLRDIVSSAAVQRHVDALETRVKTLEEKEHIKN